MGVPAIAELMVPAWYLEAMRRGASLEARRQMVRDMVLKETQAMAAERGEPVPQAPDEDAVKVTYEMYEFAVSLGNG